MKPGRKPAGKPPADKSTQNHWHALVRFLVLRNVVVAAIIAVSLGLVLYLVLAQPRTNASASPSPEPAQPAESIGVPTAEVTQASQPEFRLPPAVQGLERPEFIEPPPEIMALAKPPVYPITDGDVVYFNCEESNFAVVEENEDYIHWIVTMGEGQYHHQYTFFLSCGHTVTQTPDPYRNVMYKYPKNVAAEYKQITCASCKALGETLAAKKAD